MIKKLLCTDVGKILKLSGGTIIIALVSFFTIPILTRVMTPELYGQFNLFISSSNFLKAIISIGLLDYFLRFYYEHEDEYSSFLLVPLIGCTITCIVVTLIILIFDIQVMESGNTLTVLSIMIFALGIIFTTLESGNERYRGKYLRFTLISVIAGVSYRLLAIPFAMLEVKNDHLFFYVSISYFLLSILFLCIYGKIRLPVHVPRNLKREFMFGLLSWPSMMTSYGNTYLTQRCLQQLTSDYLLGIYTGTNIFVGIVNIGQAGLKNFWFPYVYKNYKSNQEYIKFLQKISVIFLCYITVMMICFRPILFFLLGADYRESKSFFAFVIVGAILSTLSELSGIGIGIACKAKINSLLMFLFVICNIGFVYILVPYFGIAGAGMANMFASLVFYIIRTIIGQGYYRTIYNLGMEIINVAVIVFAAIGNYIIYDDRKVVVYEIGILLVITWVNFKTIREFAGNIKNQFRVE